MSRRYKQTEINPEILQLFEKVKQDYGKNYQVFFIDIGLDDDHHNVCVRVHLYDLGQQPLLPPNKVRFYYYNVSRQPMRGPYPDRLPGSCLQAGASMGLYSSGTVGTACYDRSGSTHTYLLTCNHIIQGVIGDLVYQPSLGDGGSDQDPVGFVHAFCHHMDAALIKVLDHRLMNFKPEIMGDSVTISGVRQASLGDVLIKSGRTTGITQAIVDGINGIYYPRSRPGIEIKNCLRLVPCDSSDLSQKEISYAGDSGAVWLDRKTGEGIGLHLDGSKSNSLSQEYALAVDLGSILSLFNLTLTAPDLML